MDQKERTQSKTSDCEFREKFSKFKGTSQTTPQWNFSTKPQPTKIINQPSYNMKSCFERRKLQTKPNTEEELQRDNNTKEKKMRDNFDSTPQNRFKSEFNQQLDVQQLSNPAHIDEMYQMQDVLPLDEINSEDEQLNWIGEIKHDSSLLQKVSEIKQLPAQYLSEVFSHGLQLDIDDKIQGTCNSPTSNKLVSGSEMKGKEQALDAQAALNKVHEPLAYSYQNDAHKDTIPKVAIDDSPHVVLIDPAIHTDANPEQEPSTQLSIPASGNQSQLNIPLQPNLLSNVLKRVINIESDTMRQSIEEKLLEAEQDYSRKIAKLLHPFLVKDHMQGSQLDIQNYFGLIDIKNIQVTERENLEEEVGQNNIKESSNILVNQNESSSLFYQQPSQEKRKSQKKDIKKQRYAAIYFDSYIYQDDVQHDLKGIDFKLTIDRTINEKYHVAKMTDAIKKQFSIQGRQIILILIGTDAFENVPVEIKLEYKKDFKIWQQNSYYMKIKS